MSPPKKQTTVASDFFTRGKKPTTNARVITAKKAIVSASTPPKPLSKKQIEQDDIDEVQDFDSDEDEDDVQAASEEEPHEDENQEEEEEEEDLSVVRDDEIQSDDSTDFGFGHKVERATPTPVATQHKLPGRVATTPAKGARANNRKKVTVPTYVDVGDIHVGCRSILPFISILWGRYSYQAWYLLILTLNNNVVHQADLSEQEKILRQFDLSSKYGPCTDMTRMERWERAFTLVSNIQTYNAPCFFFFAVPLTVHIGYMRIGLFMQGLNPPQHIKDTLSEHSSLNTPLFEGRV